MLQTHGDGKGATGRRGGADGEGNCDDDKLTGQGGGQWQGGGQ